MEKRMFIFFRALKSGMEAIHLLFSNELATHLSNQISVVEHKSERKEICLYVFWYIWSEFLTNYNTPKDIKKKKQKK